MLRKLSSLRGDVHLGRISSKARSTPPNNAVAMNSANGMYI